MGSLIVSLNSFNISVSTTCGLIFEDMKMGEDQVFLAKCSLEESETKFVDLVAYEYFVGLDGQLTQNRNHIKEVLRALDSLNKYFVSSNQNKSRYQKQIELNLIII